MKIVSHNRELVSLRLAASAVVNKAGRLSQVRLVLVADDLNGPIRPRKSLDFLFFSGTVNSNEIRDRLSLDDSGKFRHDGASLKLIANPDAPYSASVTVFLHCGQLLGCNILRMPLLSPRGNNEVHLASVADFITYKVLRIGQAECADKPGLVDSLKKWILHRECCPPVHLTPDQVGVVQCYLPDLVEHEWNERGWRMNLGLL